MDRFMSEGGLRVLIDTMRVRHAVRFIGSSDSVVLTLVLDGIKSMITTREGLDHLLAHPNGIEAILRCSHFRTHSSW